MAWIYLLIAGVLEIMWAIGLKYTEGFSRLWPSVGTLAAMVVSFFFLSQALKTLPVGTALFGILLFGESREAGRLACIVLIVAGIIGLKLTSAQ